MICEFCDGNTRSKTVRRQHWLDGKLYIIENVTAEVCSECGERYFHATVLDQIDRLLQSNHPVKQTLQVEVVSL
jgi:YgiT-type zinc finger domain-containing protein